MDKISRKLIKYLSQNSKDRAMLCSYSSKFSKHCDTNVVELSKAISINRSDLLSSVHYLKEVGLVKDCKFSSGEVVGFQPTHKGKHYSEFYWIDVRDNMWKSVFVPIIVSLATNLILSVLR